jgi:tetratricopeptide (TPR) repeat protein
MDLVEVEHEVTNFLLTALEFPYHPDMGMLQCRKAMEYILKNKYYEEYGEYPETDKEGKYPSLIKVWKGIEKNLQKQTSEIIFSINSQTRGSLHWDFNSRNDTLQQRHVDAVIGQITNLFEDVFGIVIVLQGLKISDEKLENNVNIFVDEGLNKEGITQDSIPSKENVDIEKLGTILNVAEAAKRKGVEFNNRELVKLGIAARLRGELEISEGYYRQAIRKFKNVKNRIGESSALNNLGIIADTRGDLEEAERLYKESLLITREIGDRRGGESDTLNNLGNIARIRGDLEDAERLYKESLKLRLEIGIPILGWYIENGFTDPDEPWDLSLIHSPTI